MVTATTTVGCGSAPRRLEIRSDPVGADIVNRAGEKIGQTPFTLEAEALDRVEQDGLAFLNLQLAGYEDKTLILEPKAETGVDVKMRKLEEGYYKTRTLRDFAAETNAMVRELLRIQGLLLMRKTDETERALADFQKQYSYIAATYVMMANVALLKGDKTSAKNNLLRAKSIDPIDPVVSRMLKALGAGP